MCHILPQLHKSQGLVFTNQTTLQGATLLNDQFVLDDNQTLWCGYLLGHHFPCCFIWKLLIAYRCARGALLWSYIVLFFTGLNHVIVRNSIRLQMSRKKVINWNTSTLWNRVWIKVICGTSIRLSSSAKPCAKILFQQLESFGCVFFAINGHWISW